MGREMVSACQFGFRGLCKAAAILAMIVILVVQSRYLRSARQADSQTGTALAEADEHYRQGTARLADAQQLLSERLADRKQARANVARLQEEIKGLRVLVRDLENIPPAIIELEAALNAFTKAESDFYRSLGILESDLAKRR
jgi:hypothetical protein